MLLTILVALAVSVEAQPLRVSLDCGAATIWLGMSKKEAIKVLSDEGYAPVKEASSQGYEIFLNETLKKTCDLGFGANRLVYAARDWVDTENGVDGVFNGMIGVVQSMTRGKRTRGCDLFPRHTVTPDGPTDSAMVICGERSISIERIHLPHSMVIYAIKEEIGTIP
jgi:hypothetical protein